MGNDMKGMHETWDRKDVDEMDNQDQRHVKGGWNYAGVWMENGWNEHDKEYGMQEMDDMSRSNMWTNDGNM